MVDLRRVLKKAFIANKQGFRQFGTDSEEARENRIKWLMKKHGTTRNEVEEAEKEYERKKQQPKEKQNPVVKNFFSNQQSTQQQPRQSPSSPSRGFSLPS